VTRSAAGSSSARRWSPRCIAAVIVAVLGVAGAGLIARSVGLEGDTAQAFITYWTALCATFLPYAFTPLIDSAFLSMGDSKRPMLLQGLGLGANIRLDAALHL
jgi:Na+-driven multidrug efflux pump